MSFLVKLPIEHYARDAFAQFADRPAFDIGNARAMAWMCQLAYETDEPDKIAKILTDRGFTLFDGGVLIREAKTVLPMADTHCFLARHNQTGITIVAFAGTDPLSLANWVSDFNARSGQEDRGSRRLSRCGRRRHERPAAIARAFRSTGRQVDRHRPQPGRCHCGVDRRADRKGASQRHRRSTPTACRGRETRGWSIPITLPGWACARTGWCMATTSWRRWRRARSASCISAGFSPASGWQSSSRPIWRPIPVRTFRRSRAASLRVSGSTSTARSPRWRSGSG